MPSGGCVASLSPGSLAAYSRWVTPHIAGSFASVFGGLMAHAVMVAHDSAIVRRQSIDQARLGVCDIGIPRRLVEC